MKREDSLELLKRLGASRRLIKHAELVSEAGEPIIKRLVSLGIPLDCELARAGFVLHDAGKISFPAELTGSGSRHQEAGWRLLSHAGVNPSLAQMCINHGSWSESSSLEELVVACADKLWKGVRVKELEDLIVQEVSRILPSASYWDLYIGLDTLFEELADGGAERLKYSRV